MQRKTKRIGVRVEPSTWEALAAAAALEGRTPSDLARFWIELELGLASETGQKPGKTGQNSLRAKSSKSTGSRTPKKVNKGKRDA